MDLLTFQNEAEKVIGSAAAECERSQQTGDVEGLAALEEKLVKMIKSASNLPSEPAVLESLRSELKKVRQVKTGLVVHT